MASTKDMALLPREVLVAAQGSGLSSVRQYHSAVVPAKAGTHMWTAPWLQEFVRVNPIACDHMSGLLSRSHMTAAKMGSATRGPNSQTASFANGSHGLSRVLGSIDHTHLLEQARPPACGVSRMPNSVIRLISWRSC